MDESKGFLWGIGSAITYALYIVFNRKIPAQIPALTRSFYQLLFGAVTMLPFLDASIQSVTLKDVNWLMAIGLFQGFLAISLFTFAVKHLKTVEYGTVSYIEPLIASLIGVFLYSESLTLSQFVGCTIVFSGGMIQVDIGADEIGDSDVMDLCNRLTNFIQDMLAGHRVTAGFVFR